MEITSVYFNKANIRFGFKNIDMTRLNRVSQLINLNMGEGTSYVISLLPSKTENRVLDSALSIILRPGTVETLVKLFDLLASSCLFCCDDSDVDYSLREIWVCLYMDYSKTYREIQESYIPTTISVFGGISLTCWDPSDSQYNALSVKTEFYDEYIPRLKQRWKEYKDRNVCLPFSLWDNLSIDIVPNIKAKENQCIYFKAILDRMTPNNPNWIIKFKVMNYMKSAYCYLKCENQESADKIYKKVSKLNRQVSRTIRKGGSSVNVNTYAEISFAKIPSDNESIYVVIKDKFVVGQIQLYELFRIQCTICEVNQDKMLKCSGCNKEYYCSRECQVKDWPNHKMRCKKGQIDK